MKTEDVRVVILAGGKGTRLRPYSTVLPKPLMPIGEMPILEVVLRQLHAHGFRKITLSVNHLADLIQAFFGGGEGLGLDICYCIEDRPLGTAGSLSLVDDLTEHFLVMNGDLLTTLNYRRLMDRHLERNATATVGVYSREVKIDFGVLDVDEDGNVVNYIEKPEFHYQVSMGVNAFHRSVLDFISPDEPMNIPDLVLALRGAGHDVQAFIEECEWLDIGRPDDYQAAIDRFEKNHEAYLNP